MPNVEDVQRHLTDNINAITWAGLEVRGTTYHFKIVEKRTERKGTKAAKFSSKKSDYYKTFVEVGKPVVLKNDHVEKGQILVSGIYGNEESPTIVSAKGIVYGETWYTSKVDVPLKTQFKCILVMYTMNIFLNLGIRK